MSTQIIEVNATGFSPEKIESIHAFAAWNRGEETEINFELGWEKPHFHRGLLFRRKPDPYAALKAAHKAGKVIQVFKDTWKDMNFEPHWNEAPDRYRIKPEPDAEGWILWDKQSFPVGPDVVIELRRERGIFSKAMPASRHSWTADIIAYRIAKPDVKPWTRDTCPALPFEVVYKANGHRVAVVAAGNSNVWLGADEHSPENYKTLLERYTMRDGSPCGEVAK